MSKQEDFHRPEKPLEKTRETDNEARISKEAEMSSLIFLVNHFDQLFSKLQFGSRKGSSAQKCLVSLIELRKASLGN